MSIIEKQIGGYFSTPPLVAGFRNSGISIDDNEAIIEHTSGQISVVSEEALLALGIRFYQPSGTKDPARVALLAAKDNSVIGLAFAPASGVFDTLLERDSQGVLQVFDMGTSTTGSINANLTSPIINPGPAIVRDSTATNPQITVANNQLTMVNNRTTPTSTNTQQPSFIRLEETVGGTLYDTSSVLGTYSNTTVTDPKTQIGATGLTAFPVGNSLAIHYDATTTGFSGTDSNTNNTFNIHKDGFTFTDTVNDTTTSLTNGFITSAAISAPNDKSTLNANQLQVRNAAGDLTTLTPSSLSHVPVSALAGVTLSSTGLYPTGTDLKNRRGSNWSISAGWTIVNADSWGNQSYLTTVTQVDTGVKHKCLNIWNTLAVTRTGANVASVTATNAIPVAWLPVNGSGECWGVITALNPTGDPYSCYFTINGGGYLQIFQGPTETAGLFQTGSTYQFPPQTLWYV